MPTIPLKSATCAYQIVIGSDLLQNLATRLRSLGISQSARLFCISSPEIWALWSGPVMASFPVNRKPGVLLLPSGERNKRLSSVEQLAQELALHRADRDTVLLALGGGVVGDITGFLAAIYMRGVRYIQLPTTLLAQVDSAVGGKTGVNLAAGKNLVGSFHQPLAVFADTATLHTLPSRELRAGMQEAIKAGLLGDARLFRLLERRADTLLDPAHPGHRATLTRAVSASVRVKADIVASDEREAGRRMLLNLGHTLGHAIETATRYRALLHGEAVGWGMIAALHLSRQRGAIPAAEAERAERLILRFGPLPRFRATAEQLVGLAAADKKVRDGVLSFVLPVSLGRAEVVRDVGEPELLEAVASMLDRMRTHGVAAKSIDPSPSPRRRSSRL